MDLNELATNKKMLAAIPHNYCIIWYIRWQGFFGERSNLKFQSQNHSLIQPESVAISYEHQLNPENWKSIDSFDLAKAYRNISI